MNYKMMGRFIGHILLVEAVFMTVPLAISLAQKEGWQQLVLLPVLVLFWFWRCS